jgi:VIT1/CCC1 family predicted Fe2+/Mn2+ transporter
LGIAMLVVSVVGFVLSIVGTIDGSKVIRANVWVPIALFALSGLGYAFMIFLKPKMVQ